MLTASYSLETRLILGLPYSESLAAQAKVHCKSNVMGPGLFVLQRVGSGQHTQNSIDCKNFLVPQRSKGHGNQDIGPNCHLSCSAEPVPCNKSSAKKTISPTTATLDRASCLPLQSSTPQLVQFLGRPNEKLIWDLVRLRRYWLCPGTSTSICACLSLSGYRAASIIFLLAWSAAMIPAAPATEAL